MEQQPGRPGGEPEMTVGLRALAVIESVLARSSRCWRGSACWWSVSTWLKERMRSGWRCSRMACCAGSAGKLRRCWAAGRLAAPAAARRGIRVVIAWLSLSRPRAWRSISGCVRRAAMLTSPRRRFCAKPKAMNRPGMAIAEVLNASATTRSFVKTVARVQGTGCELFLLHARSIPEQRRINLSRPLGAIRSARAYALPGAHFREPAGAASPVEERPGWRSRRAEQAARDWPCPGCAHCSRCVALTAVRATADHQGHVQKRVRDHHGRS